MMHGVLTGMHSSPTRVPPGLVAITSPHDGREHLVDEMVFARSWTGRWPARCGTLVVSGPLEAGPGRRCGLCDPGGGTAGRHAGGSTAQRAGAAIPQRGPAGRGEGAR